MLSNYKLKCLPHKKCNVESVINMEDAVNISYDDDDDDDDDGRKFSLS